MVHEKVISPKHNLVLNVHDTELAEFFTFKATGSRTSNLLAPSLHYPSIEMLTAVSVVLGAMGGGQNNL